MEDLEDLLKASLDAVSKAVDLAQLEAVRVQLLGKKGQLTAQLKGLKSLSDQARPKAGQALNRIKATLLEALAARKVALTDTLVSQKLTQDQLDVMLPGRGMDRGGLHPVTHVFERINAFLPVWDLRLLWVLK